MNFKSLKDLLISKETFSYQGRMSRNDFLKRVLICSALLFVLFLCYLVPHILFAKTVNILVLVFLKLDKLVCLCGSCYIIAFPIGFAGIKRLHDIEHSGYWELLPLVSLLWIIPERDEYTVAFICFTVIYLLLTLTLISAMWYRKSQSEGVENKYGPDSYKAEFTNDEEAEKEQKAIKKSSAKAAPRMVEVPGLKLKMETTAVTQELYEAVMEENPSKNVNADCPVENVSWYDAIYFCNKLSEKSKLTPVYAVDGKTDVEEWNYTPHTEGIISGEITQNTDAKGYRLPSVEERIYAAKGGQECKFPGSEKLYEVAWYKDNSLKTTHEVATRKANGYGLYDMAGNVCEWLWDTDSYDSEKRSGSGGSFYDASYRCTVDFICSEKAKKSSDISGFRVVCSGK